MSFWMLQADDMEDTVYLVPYLFTFSGARGRWSSVLQLKRHMLIAILIASIVFSCIVTVSGLLLGWAATAYATRGHGQRTLGWTVDAAVSLFLLYAATKILQSCIRLAGFLRKRDSSARPPG